MSLHNCLLCYYTVHLRARPILRFYCNIFVIVIFSTAVRGAGTFPFVGKYPKDEKGVPPFNPLGASNDCFRL